MTRIGLVCPYSFDEPGGVQVHVTDLAEHLCARGHFARVIAPGAPGTALPALVAGAGRAVGIPFNGSVARLALHPQAVARTRAWLRRGRFDVLHVHEPLTPSIGLPALALARAAGTPVVATVHSAMAPGTTRTLALAAPALRRVFAGVEVRIAVSEEAAATFRRYTGLTAQQVIPNGVQVARFATAAPHPQWQGSVQEPTIGFLGRLDEPRKGLVLLVRAYLDLLERLPGARLLIAGRGSAGEARALLAAHPARPLQTGRAELLGALEESTKGSFLRSVDLYVAPQTGGESFGIVLVEAMAAGTPVLAADLPAFRAVLQDGRAGTLSPAGDATALGHALVRLLTTPEGRARAARAAAYGRQAVTAYDWSTVTERIEACYETAIRSVPPGRGRG